MTTQANNVAIESSQINSSGVLLTPGGGTGLSTVGTNGQVLTSNGTTLSWVTPTTTSPGGSAGYVQYNTGSAFGGSANFFWDNTNSRLGIGNSSPATTLDILGKILFSNTGGNTGAMTNGTTTGDIRIYGGSSTTNGSGIIMYGGSHGATPNLMTFNYGSTETMRIDSSGNVGIGTSSPTAKLQISNSTAGQAGLIVTSNSKSAIYLDYLGGGTNYWQSTGNQLWTNFGASTTYMTLDTSGNLILNNGGVINNSSGRPMVKQTGGVLQVVSVTDTAQYVFNTGSANQFTYYDISGLTLTITPSSTSSKILIFADICSGQYANGYNAFFRINRAGSAVGVGVNGSYGGSSSNGMRTVDGSEIGSVSFQYLDSPATTSATTYKIQICNSGGGSYPSTVNRPYNSSTGWEQSGQSTFTIMEIAG